MLQHERGSLVSPLPCRALEALTSREPARVASAKKKASDGVKEPGTAGVGGAEPTELTWPMTGTLLHAVLPHVCRLAGYWEELEVHRSAQDGLSALGSSGQQPLCVRDGYV